MASSLVVIETAGDRRLDVPLDRLGGQGVFVKEVQAAVIGGEADAAVHSAKDLPASAELGVPGLVLAAFPERADARDVLVGARLDSLPVGATVATGSARRRVQLANLRPDLTFAGLRGNLATRLAAVGQGAVAAVVVAKAALDRLGGRPPIRARARGARARGRCCPRSGRGHWPWSAGRTTPSRRRALAAIDDPVVAPPGHAERAFLAELGGGCTLPVGAHADGPARTLARDGGAGPPSG